MKAFRTAAAFAALATAVVAVTGRAQEPFPPQSHSVLNAAPSAYQDQDAGVLASFSAAGDNSNADSCQLKGEAMKDAAMSTAFAATAAQNGMIEVALAGLALQKSRNDQVRQFAQKVVQDYAQSNGDLDLIVRCKGLILPTGVDAKHTALVRSLNAKSGGAFDKAYLKHLAKTPSEAVALFESASKSDDPDLAAFARKGLPALQQQQLIAANLRAGVGTEVASTH